MAYDIDQQSNTTHLQIEWYGFHHSSEDIEYEVGLGSQPGADDIRSFTLIESDDNLYMFSSLELSHFQVSQMLIFSVLCVLQYVL